MSSDCKDLSSSVAGWKKFIPVSKGLSEEFFLSVEMWKITNLITVQMISDHKKMPISNFKNTTHVRTL